MSRRTYRAAKRRVTKEPVEFDYAYEVETEDGTEERVEQFVCKGEVSTLLLSELAYNADVDVATPEGMSLIREFFSGAFGDEAEYRRFFRLHTKHGDDDLLMDIVAGLVEDFAGRPTKQPSASQPGPSRTSDGSKDDGSMGVVLPGGFRTARPVVQVEQTPEEPTAPQVRAFSG